MLTIKNLSKSFSGNGDQSLVIFRDFDLEISKGSFTVIIGSNGCGKSTLLNLIAGTLPSDNGEIYLEGKKISEIPAYRRAAMISRMHQDPQTGTAPELSILENFRLASLRSSNKTLRIGITKEFRKVIAAQVKLLGLGLEDKLDKPVGQLSGGQRQALALLMAIYDPPALLLMDEPTAALDPSSAKMVMHLANDFILKQQLTTIMVTHHMEDAVQYGDRLIQLEQGRIMRDLLNEDKKALVPHDMMLWFKR
jgi:putative tryptophan/tyrosine transport system ATP-binding protein